MLARHSGSFEQIDIPEVQNADILEHAFMLVDLADLGSDPV